MPLVTPFLTRAPRWALVFILALSMSGPVITLAQEQPEVDTALVISVDVSNSVDATRYRLQLEGIAKALEDEAVIDAILTGGR
ncbi:MAG: DUF1194 domain-containing protein, partial [Hyphomonas sp.]|nr:DUF1194 domain-containing protein [Hyphomonas sp.]